MTNRNAKNKDTARNIILAFLVTLTSIIGHAQVNLQTGSATFSLPMFSWQDDKSRLNALVALSYNSGNGLKVNDMASNVGQGWNLIAGGVITRMQVGEPDDQVRNDGNGTIDDVNKYPAGYLYNTVNSSQGCPNAIGYYPIFGDRNHVYKQHNIVAADREQDYFSFQFNGRAGMFVLDKNNSDQGIMLGDSRIKISFHRDPTFAASKNCRTTITSFTITDENGLVYTFGQIELVKVLKTHPIYTWGNEIAITSPTHVNQGIYYESSFDEIPLSYNPFVINSWYLTQIQDPLVPQRTVTFNYNLEPLDNYLGVDISLSKNDNLSNGNAGSLREVVISHGRSISSTPMLSSIQCKDGHTVTFNYDNNNPRFDLVGDVPLRSVDIGYNGRMVSSYRLNTSYFILNGYGIPTTADQKAEARLCLRSVQKFGVDLKEDEPPYIFDYNLGTNATEDFVPPPYYHAKDVWGYYNGSMINNILINTPSIPLITNGISNNSLYNTLAFNQLQALCFISYDGSTGSGTNNFNTINPGFAKNGLLKSVTYPSGSILNYEYQQNIMNVMTGTNSVNRSAINSNSYTGGVHVSKTTQTDGGYSNGYASPLSTTYNYVDASGTLTSQWGYENHYNFILSSYSFKLEGSHHPFLESCKYDYSYAGITSKEDASSLSDAKNLISISDLIGAGIHVAASVYETIYGLTHVVNPYSYIFDALVFLSDYLLPSCTDGAQQGYTATWKNSSANINPYPIQFSRVEVVPSSGNVQGIGKTVYEFTDFSDYPLWDANLPQSPTNANYNPLAMQQRSGFWAYGLPKKTTVYDASGNMIKQTENIYNWNNAKKAIGSDMSCNCFSFPTSRNNNDWSNFSNPGNISYSPNNIIISGSKTINQLPIFTGNGLSIYAKTYNVYTGRVELAEAHEKTFKPGDQTQYFETVTKYDYNTANFQLKKVTSTLSNGDLDIKEIYYPEDYTAPGIIQTLKNNNMVNVPIGNFSSILKNGASTPAYMGASVTNLGTIANGDIKPLSSMVSRATQPVTGFQFDPSRPFNYPNLVQTQAFNYDANGNLVGITDEGGRSITNIYGYNDKFIIASVINAEPSLDRPAYTSFEDPTSNGGWSLNGTANYNANSSVTGNNSLDLINGAISLSASSLNTAKKYRLSFWSTGNVNINGGSATAITSSPMVNGFTYHEYEIGSGTSSISLSGNGYIDELRLCPKMARMRTITYDPLINKTSECDENNHVTYYEYDNLSRPRFVRDENRNIVKMYEYNARQNQGTNIGVAAIVPVYSRLTYENRITNGDEVTADVVVSFYSDAAGTQPVTVGNLPIAINSTAYGISSPGPTTIPRTANGNKLILPQQILASSYEHIGPHDDDPTYMVYYGFDYSIVPGTGYFVIK